ncbi:PhoH family protein [Glaciimonas sp. CA11.2]|uniref:PhoH family protein n=1 Tax=unclassified Glaciimonas TaxID=2644401 RepID=UPI002AB5CC91|nr:MULTISPECIES: PhoH family protein [unclassified Glaciimonas]MDY7545133.1 PhoH family protein [Glaciimonas sp. CA11.2]MEB0011369.1 PhoH family protein [Glaciimonas sp. Cout2]MEB0081019.1 PhoH family protein [Glaciimonas sp. Gout2]MEB0164110.1 PhoH family protein [Glaciimonas sp. CA11.2]
MKTKTKTPSQPFYFTPEPLDNTRLAHLCGPLDENLRQISAALDVTLFRRGEKFIASGANAERAVSMLEQFYALAHRVISVDEIQLALVEQRANQAHKRSNGVNGGEDGDEDVDDIISDPYITTPIPPSQIESPVLKTRRADLRGRTPHQIAYIRAILEHDVTLGIGPAGTGKTYLAVACAVDALERDAVKRIVLTRPAVEAGERLGFLPGDLAQKVDPYLRPLYDALYDLLGFDRTQKMFEKQAIEIAPLAYMRGRTLNHAFIILDEAQNTTPEQMKMFLTRIGFGSKAVVTGDVTQIDLQRGQKSGLIDAMNIMKDVRGIAFTRFNSTDVVRHPLVARIVDAYEAASLATPVASTHGVLDPVSPPIKAIKLPKPIETGITKRARSRNVAKK